MSQNAVIQADYEALTRIQSLFDGMCRNTEILQTRLKRTHERMMDESEGDWANKYNAEMESCVWPTLRRLHDVLDESAHTIQMISNHVADVEERAAALFNGSSNAVLLASATLGQGVATAVPSTWKTIDNKSKFGDISVAYDEVNVSLKGKGGLASQVKFFEAAGKVTGSLRLGMLETLHVGFVTEEGRIDLSDKGLAYMQGLSRHLYQTVNMPHALRLMQMENGALLPSPDGGPQTFRTPLEHDLRMVEVEQRAVKTYISEGLASNQLSMTDVQRLTNGINSNWFGSENDWVENALGREPDFLKTEDRVALGQAMIFDLHKKDERDFRVYLKNKNK